MVNLDMAYRSRHSVFHVFHSKYNYINHFGGIFEHAKFLWVGVAYVCFKLAAHVCCNTHTVEWSNIHKFMT